MNKNKTGELIRKLREQYNMTQDDLAKNLFVDRTLVNKWERGATSIASEHLKKIGKIFNVSLEELISGELLSKDNKAEVNEVKYKIYDKYLKNIKRFKFVLVTLIIILLLFFAYFFFTFYNSVVIYNIHVDSKEIEVDDGVLIKTRDYLIFNLNINQESFKELILYSEIDYKEKNILRTNNNGIYIIDYIDNQEYFDFNKINDIINNLYLKIKLKNNKSIDAKINLTKMYSNNKIFFKARKGATPIVDLDSNETSSSILKEKYEEVYKKYSNSTKKITINNKDYEVFIFEGKLYIKYSENDSNYMLIYTKFDSEYIIKIKDDQEIYSDTIEKDKCKKNDCNDDINLLMEVIDNLLKNKK